MVAAVSGIFAFRAALRTTPITRWPQSSPRPAMPAAQASSTRKALCTSRRTTAAVPSAWAPVSASASATRARAWSRSRPIGYPRGPRRTPIRDLPGDPASSAEGFEAADFGCGPAWSRPSRVRGAPDRATNFWNGAQSHVLVRTGHDDGALRFAVQVHTRSCRRQGLPDCHGAGIPVCRACCTGDRRPWRRSWPRVTAQGMSASPGRDARMPPGPQGWVPG
jgi:hypothetical protein